MNDDALRCRDDELIGLDATRHRLISQIQERAHQRVIPLNVLMEVTLRCNIRCLHCYNFDRDQPREACGDGPELSTDEILGAMQQVRDAGCLFLSLTGGEVLSHPDLFTFLDRARDLHLAVQLLSNGTLLRPGTAGRLAKYKNLLGVSVSLYGATPEVHDGITQVRGSWRRTWHGIERLQGLGVAVRLKYIVMRQNAHEVEAIRADGAARGLTYQFDLTITRRHDRSEGSLATRVDAEQLERLYRGPLRDLLPSGGRTATDESTRCNCARGNAAISAHGDVYPCISVPWSAGNLRQRGFREIWESSPVFQRIRGLRLSDYPHCAPCAHKAHCSRDRGAAYNASGEYTGIDPFTCSTAELAHRLADEQAAVTAPPPAR